jgi:hypothetical protein
MTPIAFPRLRLRMTYVTTILRLPEILEPFRGRAG